MKKVIVTGAAGFIGSNLVEYLLKNTDFQIYGIDNLQSGAVIYNTFLNKIEIENKDRFQFIKDDIKNINNHFSDGTDIDFMFHLAATPRVSYSVEYPFETNDNNVSNSLILMDWCVKHKIKKFVFSSSSSVYGNVDNFPTKETNKLSPMSPYALQKKIIEEYCKLYSELYGLQTVCLRYFNVYGPNQYADSAYATVICAWIKNILNSEPLRLDGDGTQSRDFTYVYDVCQANLIAANLDINCSAEVFNVGGDNTISLLEILEKIKKLTSIETPKMEYSNFRVGDVYKTESDMAKLKSFGFKHSFSIDNGLEKTYNWYKQIL